MPGGGAVQGKSCQWTPGDGIRVEGMGQGAMVGKRVGNRVCLETFVCAAEIDTNGAVRNPVWGNPADWKKVVHA